MPPGPAKSGRPALPWRGDVEPVPFPFRLGVTTKLQPHLLCFDDGGEWLLAGAGQGLLHLARVDGTHTETPPRGMYEGEVLTNVFAALGVAGGFVVAGRLGKWLVAMHYNLETRKCSAHLLGSLLDSSWEWFYFREFHSVVARDNSVKYALDLTTGHTFTHQRGEGGKSRAEKACYLADSYEVPPPRLAAATGGPSIVLESESGMLFVDGVSPAWQPNIPQTDGKPALEGSMILQAELCGNTLAVLCSHPSLVGPRILRMFRGPDCTPLCEFPCAALGNSGFSLSSDGRLLARQTLAGFTVEVTDLLHGNRPLQALGRGKVPPQLEVELGDCWMVVQVGKLNHVIHWFGGKLGLHCAREEKEGFVKRLVPFHWRQAPRAFARLASAP